ncbi:MAG: putative Ig domain-containing protein [Chloroflexi bacterium]|nr:putative Ig domain-containing protein [Chloroflexota bacterium]
MCHRKTSALLVVAVTALALLLLVVLAACGSTAPTIATNSLPDGEVGVAYSQVVAVIGGTGPYTWSVSLGSLPAGLSLDSSTGTIAGTPTAEGARGFTIKVADNVGGRATAGLYISISPALTITAASLPDSQVGVAYSRVVAATGGSPPYTWSVRSGNLPAGLSLDSSTGAVAGTLTAVGAYNSTIKVADSVGGAATASLSVTISSAPTITTASLADGEVSVAYSQVVAATGGSLPYTWSVSSGSLPAGLSLDSHTGVITGTPTAEGAYNSTVKVADNVGGAATASLSVTISSAPTITTASLADGEVGIAYSQVMAATGGSPPYTWSVSSGNLPAGLSLDSHTGVISGTPTAEGADNFTIRAVDSVGAAATASLSISCTAPQVYCVDASYTGEVIDIPLNCYLVVMLEDNHGSTGFSWPEQADISDETVLTQIDREYVPPESGATGAPGTAVWVFRALGKGTCIVFMECRQPWAPSGQPASVFDLTVVVQ